MSQSSFRLGLKIPKRVRVRPEGAGTSADQARALDREEFSAWLWRRFQGSGLLGIHEGTLLAEEAMEQGLEMESWTVDSGEAPRERDWISGQEWVRSELYFGSREAATWAATELRARTDAEVGGVEEQEARDWDAQWKASFLGSRDGVRVPPFWRILPPWVDADPRLSEAERIVRISPGAGFGTGTHETTQLCLRAIAEWGKLGPGKRVLDFGSGSGILSIGAALLGARVDGVEIDSLAIDNATENSALNGTEGAIAFCRELEAEAGPYDLVIANILRPVLLEFAEKLTGLLRAGRPLILSGLIDRDVAEVRSRYSALLGGREPRVLELAEWRALVWDDEEGAKDG